jgi:hypothetical protein
MEYPNYITMELYSEQDDGFRFNYYYTLKDSKGLLGVLGRLSVGRMIKDNRKKSKDGYVDKPYWNWDFDDLKIDSSGYVKTRTDEDGDGVSISLDRLKMILSIVENVESSGDPLAVPDTIKVQYIRSKKYNTLK